MTLHKENRIDSPNINRNMEWNPKHICAQLIFLSISHKTDREVLLPELQIQDLFINELYDAEIFRKYHRHRVTCLISLRKNVLIIPILSEI